uniref:type I protein arginine methyltransferase n=1 Tax=Oryzias latipes TaxID=8090 RepID=A0A3P9JHR2_ORYLA
MEESRKELHTFSVKVFTLQEEVEDEETPGQVDTVMFKENEAQMEIRGGQHVSMCSQANGQELTLILTSGARPQQLAVQDANRATVFQLTLCEKVDHCRVGGQSFLVCVGKLNLLLQFASSTDLKSFQEKLKRRDDGESREGRTEEPKQGRQSSDRNQNAMEIHPLLNEPKAGDLNSAWVHNYLCQQQNLLRDYLRTATYQKAFLANEDDFKDKVVLDVCSGSGILSFFAIQAGASRVYAVESSPVAEYIQILVRANRLSEQIVVLEGQVEQLSLPVMVDIIVSEPMGCLLLSGRLMERFLHARRWLKPNGLMFPSCADLHLAPFSDEQLYLEQNARVNFWQQRSFYGVDLSALHNAAADEFFRYPVVDTFDGHILVARSVKHRINFLELKEEDLHRIEIPFVFTLLQSGLVHGLAFWFDLAFLGSRSTVWLSTAPSEPLTRWSQVRCLLQTPLFTKLGQTLSGTALLTSNSSKESYDIQITATVDQSGFRSGNKLDLKNSFFQVATTSSLI